MPSWSITALVLLGALLPALYFPSLQSLDVKQLLYPVTSFRSATTAPNSLDTRPLLDQAVKSLHAFRRINVNAVKAKRRTSSKSPLYKSLRLDERYQEMEWSIHDDNEICKKLIQISKTVQPVNHTISSPAKFKQDIGRVRELFSHFSRDWSEEGSYERQQILPPILERLKERFPEGERNNEKVLVPGAGLSRLSYGK